MSRKICGWLAIGLGFLLAILTVPVWTVQGSAPGGSIRIDSSPLETAVQGQGNFSYDAFWSVSWIMAAICLTMIGSGVMLLRTSRRANAAV